MNTIPKWADVVLIPLIGLLLAAILSGLMIWASGESPSGALWTMVQGALLTSNGWGYVLYYATNFIFTGLAVSIAFHARMFNIGGEGQAMLGGLGLTLAMLYLPLPHWTVALVAGILAGALFGAAWAAIPAWLQAKRGSHIVITTIMFNFIAFSLLNYMLSEALRPKGAMDPASAKFPESTNLPTLHDMAQIFGSDLFRASPANVALIVALLAAVGLWVLIWKTTLGYEIRAFGHSEPAAAYAGISGTKIIMIAMLISGALAGCMAVNNVQGEAERLVLNSVEGAGFIGIAVALMGRSHPLGVVVAALLFGFLYQGGAELGLWTSIPREMVVVIQALVILFTGALDNMVRMALAPLFRPFMRSGVAAE